MNDVRYQFFKTINELINHKKNESKTIVIHSSFARLLPPKNFNKWDALYAIDYLVRRGFTFAFPSFTFSFCKSKFYSEKESPSETGIFSEWVLNNFENSIRTNHPIYSFVIIGPKVDHFRKFSNETCWGKGSIFEYFEIINSQILILGAGLESVTQFHRYEETLKVPYRKYKRFEGTAEFSHYKKNIEVEMYVRDLYLQPENNMNLIAEPIRKSLSYCKRRLFRGNAEIIETKDLCEITKKELTKNQFALIENEKIVRNKIFLKNESKRQKDIRIALLGINNNDNFRIQLQRQLETYIPERSFEIYLPPYGQLMQEMIDKNSKLNSLNTFIKIFTVNFSDIKNFKNEEEINKFIKSYVELILRMHKFHKGWTFVNLFFDNNLEIDIKVSHNKIFLINKINNYIIKNLSKEKSVIIVDQISIISNKEIKINDPALWYLGRFSYSNEFTKQISFEWIKLIISILKKTIRLIILDLDNTIWGGVLGEDGIDGVSIGGDYPGNAFEDFQKELVKLNSKGIALAISSKNDENLVKKTFETLKEMPLKIDMFSALSIGWHSKSSGIKEIADSLNLGLYSVLFIDDNPAEISKVKNKYPEIKVLQLSKDPANYVDQLKKHAFIKCLSTSKEDYKRIKSFQTLVNIKKLSNDDDELNRYLKNLKIKVYFKRLDNSNLNRAYQLCQKTNQFNSTSIRYTSSDLIKLNSQNQKVIVIAHSSEESESENIGLMIIEEDYENLVIELKLYLLSCRVLGRGLEKGCIKWLANYYFEKGFLKLRANLLKNERNIPIHNTFKEIGFIENKNRSWELFLKKSFPEPECFKIYDELS